MIRNLLAVYFLAQIFVSTSTFAQSCPGTLDLIFINGTILTMDADSSIASSARVQGNKFVAVGNDIDISGNCAQVIDLEGRTVIPGLIDSHTHFIRTAQAPGPFILGQEASSTIAEYQQALRTASEKAAPGEWVVAVGGLTPLQFQEQRLPNTEELTAAVPGNPVWIQRGYLADGIVNELGRRILVQRGVPVSDDGISPAAEGGLRYILRTRTEERMLDRFRDYMNYAVSTGLTTVIDQGCCDFLGAELDIDDRPNFSVLDMLWRSDELKLRMRLQYDHRDILEQDDLRSVSARVLNSQIGIGDGFYRVVGVGERVIADEATDEEVFEAYLNVARAGWPLSQHTIWEDEIERYLSIMERVAAEIPIRELRWSLEHIFEITPNQIERLKAIGVSVRVQDHDILRNGSTGWNPGPPLKTLLESGIRMGAGTDSGVVGPLNPWLALYFMVTGKHMGGELIIPGEQISRLDALRLYTAENAWFLGEEDSLGSIETGKLADLVVLDRPFLEIAEDELRDVAPLLTLIDGKVAYATGAFSNLQSP
ncbi:MAG: amidohydrolase [Pseudohongiellaceae bacterium]